MAPNHVDRTYCAICLVLYIIEVLIVLRIDLKSKIYVGFNILFFMSFFLTSFAYPLFVYDTPADILGKIEQTINFDSLTKWSALCLIASSTYCYGYLRKLNINKCEGYRDRFISDSMVGNLSILKILYIIIFVLLFSVAFLFMRAGGSVALQGGDLLSALFEVIFPVILLTNTIKTKPQTLREFIRFNLMILVLSAAMMLVFIRIGDRGLILTCSLQIIAIYTLCVNRPKLFYIGCLMLVGVVLLFSIRQLRMSDSYAKESSIASFSNFASSSLKEYGVEYGIWYYLSDLTNISHELCLGYEYSQKNGLFYPVEEIVLAAMSPVPLLPSLFCNYVLGKPTSEYVTGEQLNKYMSSYGHANFGNHCVIDLYMMWRLLGVVIVFYLFGYFVAKSYNKVLDNLLYAALYVMLISYAIYVPRNIILSLIRPAVYIWFFVCLSNRRSNKKSSLKQISLIKSDE